MVDIERTTTGFQSVIPGCERRILPKSTTSSDDTGQGLLDFYRSPTLHEKLATLAYVNQERSFFNRGNDHQVGYGCSISHCK
jgi:hypothetical protein